MAAPDQTPHGPVECVELELTELPAPASAAPAEMLVLLHGHPLGVLRTGGAERAADGGHAAARAAFAAEVAEHLERDGLAPDDLGVAATCALDTPEPSGLVSVVVCTVGEDARLRDTVDSLRDQTWSDLEIVVVDNRPGTSRVGTILAGIDDPRVRVVTEPCRGLSAARNAGLAHARGQIVAYTDDDARAGVDWVRRLAGAFACDQRIVAVTGLVVPDELETQAQHLFEEFGAFDKGFVRTLWSARDLRVEGCVYRQGPRGALFPYSAGVYGSGNNMAFRSDWLRASGLFDEALGAGSLTRGGEDLDAFLTVMLSGGVLLYEPAAIVRHAARREMADLAAQLYGYGSGNSAVIAKHALSGPARAVRILARVPAGLRHLVDPRSQKNQRRTATYPAELGRLEQRGFAAGPFLYVRSVVEARRRRRAAPLVAVR